jgi:hypothetical protein
MQLNAVLALTLACADAQLVRKRALETYLLSMPSSTEAQLNLPAALFDVDV